MKKDIKILHLMVSKKYAYKILDLFPASERLHGGSLSSAIYFNSLSIGVKSITDKPFGWESMVMRVH